MILVDSNVPLDVVTQDPLHGVWSASTMKKLARTEQLLINSIIYAEISVTFDNVADLEISIRRMQLNLVEIPREAAFHAAKAFMQYRKLGGTKTNVLPDFFIGAHAMVLNCPILTRDVRRYQTYFPSVQLIAP